VTLKPLPPWQYPIVVKAGTAVKEFYDWVKSVDTLLRVKATPFSGLPASPTEGMLAPIIDSSVNTWGSVIAGGGGNHVLGYYNGTNWTVAAK
jgi:hypothetical protein